MRRLLVALVALLLVALGSGPAVSAPPPGEDEDLTAPTITITAPSPADGGWYPGDVNVSVRAVDTGVGASGMLGGSWTLTGASTGSGILVGTDAVTMTIASTGVTTLTIEAEDRAGNQATRTQTFRVDRLVPSLTVEAPVVDGAHFAPGQLVTFKYACQDDRSGVASCTATLPNNTALPTSQLGGHNVTITARDNAGHVTERTIRYYVTAGFALVSRPTIPLGGHPPRVGQGITATPAVFAPQPDTQRIQWYRDGVPIPGATTTTYAVQGGDLGSRLRVMSTATKANHHTMSAYSVDTEPVVSERLEMQGRPLIDGAAMTGLTLEARHGAITPTPDSVGYQWLRDGLAILGATEDSYTLGQEDFGHRITLLVLATRDTWPDELFHSEPTGIVRGQEFNEHGTATITGALRVGGELRASAPGFSPTPDSLHFQWYANGAVIEGATAATYRLAPGDVGKRISVRAEARKANYENASVLSPESATVGRATSKVQATAKALGKGKVKLAGTVRSSGVRPDGMVVVRQGKKVVARDKPLRNGSVTLTLTKLRKGSSTFRVDYLGSTSVLPSSVTTRRVVVR